MNSYCVILPQTRHIVYRFTDNDCKYGLLQFWVLLWRVQKVESLRYPTKIQFRAYHWLRLPRSKGDTHFQIAAQACLLIAWVPAKYIPAHKIIWSGSWVWGGSVGKTLYSEQELFGPIKLSGRALYEGGQMINHKRALEFRFQTWLPLESWDVMILPSSLLSRRHRQRIYFERGTEKRNQGICRWKICFFRPSYGVW